MTKKLILNEINISYQPSEYELNLIQKYNENCKLFNSEVDTTMDLLLENKKIKDELELLDTLNEDIMFEMANFKKENSGLSHDIWIDEAGVERENTHYLARIKIQDLCDPKNRVSLKIDSKEPIILAGKFVKNDDINDIIEFVKQHYADLMQVWNKKKSATWFIDKYRIK